MRWNQIIFYALMILMTNIPWEKKNGAECVVNSLRTAEHVLNY